MMDMIKKQGELIAALRAAAPANPAAAAAKPDAAPAAQLAVTDVAPIVAPVSKVQPQAQATQTLALTSGVPSKPCQPQPQTTSPNDSEQAGWRIVIVN